MNIFNNVARNRQIVQLVGISLVATAMFGCAKKEEKDTYSYLWDQKFNSCGLSCHDATVGDTTDNGPDLSTKTKFYDNLVNRSVDGNYASWVGARTSNCNNVSFIKPGDANKSTLAASMISSISASLFASNNCDSANSVHETLGVTIKDAELAQALVDWINKGAQNN